MSERIFKLTTQADLDEWNKQRLANMRPLRPNHWTHRYARRVRLIRICLEWRKQAQLWRGLANEHYDNLQKAREKGSIQAKELHAARKEIEALQRRPFSL